MSGDILWLLAAGVFFFFMMRGGGGRHEHNNHTDGATGMSCQTSVIKAASDTFRDPVCGMTVESGGDSPMSKHRGQTSNFCSEQCRKLFELNPGKYMATH